MFIESTECTSMDFFILFIFLLFLYPVLFSAFHHCHLRTAYFQIVVFSLARKTLKALLQCIFQGTVGFKKVYLLLEVQKKFSLNPSDFQKKKQDVF